MSLLNSFQIPQRLNYNEAQVLLRKIKSMLRLSVIGNRARLSAQLQDSPLLVGPVLELMQLLVLV